MGNTNNRTKKRLVICFALICLLIFALCFRVGWIQIVKGEEYKRMAAGQQTRDISIVAKRGTIYDRKGEELAISARTFSIWVRPKLLWKGEDDVSKEINAKKYLVSLSETLGIEAEKIGEMTNSDSPMVKIAKYQTKETANSIMALNIPGVETSEEVKRYYPLGPFASHILGTVTDDSMGLSGIELKYDRFLSGVSGR